MSVENMLAMTALGLICCAVIVTFTLLVAIVFAVINLFSPLKEPPCDTTGSPTSPPPPPSTPPAPAGDGPPLTYRHDN